MERALLSGALKQRWSYKNIVFYFPAGFDGSGKEARMYGGFVL